MAARKNLPSTTAEVVLTRLENCLVNLPSSLVSLLVNVNAVRRVLDLLCKARRMDSNVILGFLIACAECHNRIELSRTCPCWLEDDCFDPTLRLFGMDRSTEQATGGAHGQP